MIRGARAVAAPTEPTDVCGGATTAVTPMVTEIPIGTGVGVFARMLKETPPTTTVWGWVRVIKITELGRISVRGLPGRPGTKAWNRAVL